MQTYFIDKPDESIKAIVSKCYPSYRGKKFQLSTSIPNRLDSYWDGGSKTSYVFFNLADSNVMRVGSNHPMFGADKPRELSHLPDGVLIVAHSIFCGKDSGITIYANGIDLKPMLPESSNDLNRYHKIVLAATAGLKASYGGIKNFRFKEARNETGISWDQWESAKSELISKKLLNKAGAITASGRNVIGYARLWDFK